MATAPLFVLFLGITSAFALPNSRILEGEEAVTGQFPWTASVRLDNAHVCVGSIITENHILTAGHCLSQSGTTSYPVSRINVRVGSTNQYAGGQIVSVQNVEIHPSYGNFLHDIAIIKLSEPLVWNEKLKNIELIEEDTEVSDEDEIVVSGWGLQSNGASPYKLQHATMHLLSHADCEYRAGYGYESVMCLDHPEKQGICRGDEGAGAVTHDRLVGVLSFAFGGCGTKYPDVAARVSYYREWINSVIA